MYLINDDAFEICEELCRVLRRDKERELIWCRQQYIRRRATLSLAFMRGRTVSNAFVILDEAQNTTTTQMKMFLTRMGESSRMVITGDLTQTDLPHRTQAGLRDAVRTLDHIDDFGFMHFAKRDVIRHRLVGKIVAAYDSKE